MEGGEIMGELINVQGEDTGVTMFVRLEDVLSITRKQTTGEGEVQLTNGGKFQASKAGIKNLLFVNRLKVGEL